MNQTRQPKLMEIFPLNSRGTSVNGFAAQTNYCQFRRKTARDDAMSYKNIAKTLSSKFIKHRNNKNRYYFYQI